jgi:SAM-dependent methyltransferase
LQFGYYLPSDVYEAVVKQHVFIGCSWIDVGGGHHIFPENPTLSRSLATRCSLVVAVDPSENVNRNPFVHQRVQCLIEEYQTDRQFDLATLRMVAEHVVAPEKVVQALSRLLQPGGIVIILTVNLWAPITVISRLTPFKLHHPIKKLFWGGEVEDTFPVQYKMNSRATLHRLFSARGFREVRFAYLDDLSTFGRFKRLNYLELLAWRTFQKTGHYYPESCLLGVYQRQ